MISRRDFLKASCLSAGLLSAYPHFSSLSNEGEDDHFLLVVFLDGGWDVTLSLDPWLNETLPDPQDMFLEQLQLNKKFSDIWLGPAAHALGPYVQEMSIINGIILAKEDNGHPAAENYMRTGETSSPRQDIIAQCEHHSFKKSLLGVISNDQIISENIKMTASSPSNLYGQKDKPPLSQKMKDVLDIYQGNSPLNEAQAQAFRQSLPLKKLFTDFQHIDGSKEHEVIAQIFKNKLARFGQIKLRNNLDTHGNHEGVHLDELKKSFAGLIDIFNYFKSISINGQDSLYSKTTFLIMSEFSRTPALNGSKGKDHNPLLNSALLVGKNVKGNQVIGASKLVTRAQSKNKQSYHIALPFDYQSGVAVQDSQSAKNFIYPENIVATVGRVFDYKLNNHPYLPVFTT